METRTLEQAINYEVERLLESRAKWEHRETLNDYKADAASEDGDEQRAEIYWRRSNEALEQRKKIDSALWSLKMVLTSAGYPAEHITF